MGPKTLRKQRWVRVFSSQKHKHSKGNLIFKCDEIHTKNLLVDSCSNKGIVF
jgi:hypothetical protein